MDVDKIDREAQLEQAAAAIVQNVPIRTALREAGWSESTAKTGKRALTKPLMEAIGA